MAKYTEAFFLTSHTNQSPSCRYATSTISTIRFMKGDIRDTYFAHTVKVVPLTVVHTNGLLYFRGHPHEEHGDGCMYALKEIVIKDVEKICGDIEKAGCFST